MPASRERVFAEVIAKPDYDRAEMMLQSPDPQSFAMQLPAVQQFLETK